MARTKQRAEQQPPSVGPLVHCPEESTIDFIATAKEWLPNMPHRDLVELVQHTLADVEPKRVGRDMKLHVYLRLRRAAEAYVRHRYTDYDKKYDKNCEEKYKFLHQLTWRENRVRVKPQVDSVLNQWMGLGSELRKQGVVIADGEMAGPMTRSRTGALQNRVMFVASTLVDSLMSKGIMWLGSQQDVETELVQMAPVMAMFMRSRGWTQLEPNRHPAPQLSAKASDLVDFMHSYAADPSSVESGAETSNDDRLALTVRKPSFASSMALLTPQMSQEGPRCPPDMEIRQTVQMLVEFLSSATDDELAGTGLSMIVFVINQLAGGGLFEPEFQSLS